MLQQRHHEYWQQRLSGRENQSGNQRERRVLRQREEKWRQGGVEKRESAKKRESSTPVCSGLIRVIISLSPPGPSPELAYTAHTHAQTRIHIHMYRYTHTGKIERGGEAETKRMQIKGILMSGIRKNRPQSTYYKLALKLQGKQLFHHLLLSHFLDHVSYVSHIHTHNTTCVSSPYRKVDASTWMAWK